MKHATFATLIVAVALTAGCDQAVTRMWGGTSEVKLPPNSKLVTATWKDANLWYLIRTMRPDEQPERLVFQESSAVGLLQGKVIFVEGR